MAEKQNCRLHVRVWTALLIAMATGVLLVLGATTASASSLNASLAVGPPSAAEAAVAANEGLTYQQAHQALFAQGKIAASGVVEAVESALGPEYAGAWFDAATATLHFGVTSTHQSAVIERLVAEKAPNVAVALTEVRHTWAQLEAIQERWNRRLAPLFEQAAVKTAIDPRRNTVVVTVAGSVTPSERGLLRLDAAGSSAGVTIEATESPHIRLDREEATTTCNAFKEDAARCDGPITAGTTIRGKGNGATLCTAGPLALKKPNNHETFLLTAGHCLHEIEGVGTSWFGFNRAGEEKEIGKAKTYLLGAAADIGVIEVDNPGAWTVAGNPPAYAVSALWNAPKAPFASTPVTGQLNPMVGWQSCMQGQSTGYSCGTIIGLNTTLEGYAEHLVEVQGSKSAAGDSGGPWIANTLELAGLWIEGTHVGQMEKGTRVFEPLKTSFEKLAEAEIPISLELLTTANEKRPASPFFISEHATSWWLGEQVTQNVLTLAGGTVKCTTAKLEGGPFEGPELSSVTLHPIYTGCIAFGIKAEVVTTGCNYVMEASSVAKIECESGKSIKVNVAGAGCSVTIGSQTPSGKLDYTTGGTGSGTDILVTSTLEGIKYTSSGGVCGSSGEKGKYTGTVTEKGYSSAAHTTQNGIKWEKE